MRCLATWYRVRPPVVTYFLQQRASVRATVGMPLDDSGVRQLNPVGSLGTLSGSSDATSSVNIRVPCVDSQASRNYGKDHPTDRTGHLASRDADVSDHEMGQWAEALTLAILIRPC